MRIRRALIVVILSGACVPESARPLGLPSEDPTPAIAPADQPLAQSCIGATQHLLVLDGDPNDPIHPGTEALVGKHWYNQVYINRDHTYAYGAGAIHISDDGMMQWQVDVWTSGERLVPGTYAVTNNPSTVVDGQPGLSISNPDHHCDRIDGTYTVVDYSGSSIARDLDLTVTFEQRCNGEPTPLRGCVHYSDADIEDGPM